MKLKILVYAYLLIAALSLYAQETTNIDETETFRIKAKREVFDPKKTSLNTTIITEEEIEATGANNVAEVLKYTSGLIMRNSVSTQVSQIRGSRYEQTLVLVNGQRQSAAQNLFHDLSQYNVANIERIEIIKGAAATRYGANASAGVINIITKDRSYDGDKNFGIAGGLRYGSYNSVYADILANMSYGNKNQGNVFLSGSILTNARDYQITDETSLGTFNEKVKNNEIFMGDVRIGNSYRFNEAGNILHTSFDYFYENKNSPSEYFDDEKEPPVLGFPENSGYEYETKKYSGHISYEHYSLDIFDVFLSASTLYQTVENLGDEAAIHNSFDNFTTEVSLSMERTDNFGDGIFVFQNAVEILYRNEYFIAGPVTKGVSLDEGSTVNRNTASIAYLPSLGFFNYKETNVPRLTITPGIRFDAIFDSYEPKNDASEKTEFYKPTYSVGALYTFDKESRYLIKANFATGYRNPTFNELYLFGASSNPDLKKENIAGSGDFGLIVTLFNMFTLEGTYFISKYTDYIVYLDDGASHNVENISEYVAQGIDGALSMNIPIPVALSSVALTANYTYQFMAHGKDADSSNIIRAPFIPEHSANAILSYIYEGDMKGIFKGRINFLVNYTSAVLTTFSESAQVDGSYTFDLTASITFIEYITIEGGVRNLLNTRYDIANNFQGPGREWYVAVRGMF